MYFCRFATGVYFGHVGGVLTKVVQMFCTRVANLRWGVFWSYERNFLSNGLILEDIAFLSIKIKYDNENNFGQLVRLVQKCLTSPVCLIDWFKVIRPCQQWCGYVELAPKLIEKSKKRYDRQEKDETRERRKQMKFSTFLCQPMCRECANCAHVHGLNKVKFRPTLALTGTADHSQQTLLLMRHL